MLAFSNDYIYAGPMNFSAVKSIFEASMKDPIDNKVLLTVYLLSFFKELPESPRISNNDGL